MPAATSTLTVFGLEIPPDVQTLEGFRRWIGSLGESAPRASFCGGRVHIEMSPQNHETHEPVANAISIALGQLAQTSDVGRYYMPPSWFTNQPTGLSTEPDGFVVSWDRLKSGAVRVNPDRKTELLGCPEMVLEVVSDTSVRKDLVEHVQDYASAGIAEYWIADARADEIDFRILTLAADGSYVPQASLADGWLASPVWGRAFRLVRFCNPAGATDYRLDARS